MEAISKATEVVTMKDSTSNPSSKPTLFTIIIWFVKNLKVDGNAKAEPGFTKRTFATFFTLSKPGLDVSMNHYDMWPTFCKVETWIPTTRQNARNGAVKKNVKTLPQLLGYDTEAGTPSPLSSGCKQGDSSRTAGSPLSFPLRLCMCNSTSDVYNAVCH
jgi:hypothetical protein